MKQSTRCVAISLAVFVAAAWSDGGSSTKGSSMPVKLRLESRHPAYAPDASVIVDVTVENATSSTVQVPAPGMPTSLQPLFTLTRPDGHKLSFVPADGPRVNRQAPAQTVDIPPGDTATGDLELRGFDALDQEGDYVLDATLQVGADLVVAQAARFRIEQVPVQDVAGFLARSPDGEPAMGLVVLAKRRKLGTVQAREEDPRNGELDELEVRVGPDAERSLKVLGWVANHGLAFDPLRWMLAVTHEGITAATNLSSRVAEVGSPSRATLWMNGLVRRGWLAVPGITSRGSESELVWVKGSAPSNEPRLEKPSRLASFSGMPRVAAAALAPRDAQALLAAAVSTGDGTRLILWLVADDAVRATREFQIPGLFDARAVAVGWSSRDVLQVSVIGHGPAKQVRLADLLLRPDLSPTGQPAVSEPAGLTNTREANLVIFEQHPGTLSRVGVVRALSGTSFIGPSLEVRGFRLPEGSHAVLPGRERWYVVWPEGSALKSMTF